MDLLLIRTRTTSPVSLLTP